MTRLARVHNCDCVLVLEPAVQLLAGFLSADLLAPLFEANYSKRIKHIWMLLLLEQAGWTMCQCTYTTANKAIIKRQQES